MSLGLAILSDLRIIERSAFVAAPLGGLTLAQLGAEVIRIDPIDGGLDFHRWPVTQDNISLFWAGLNRGKKSIQVDFRTQKGRELISNLITAPGDGAGIFLTNLPVKDELTYEELRKKRPDIIMISLTGNFNGSSEVDYTVHPSFGYPMITGPKGSENPTNNVLPTWDLLLGNMVAIAILAAERKRRITGDGEFISIALSDVALSIVGALGRLSQAHLATEEIGPDGNFLYGSFGKNFMTCDQHEIMLVGLTLRQWNALKTALNLHKPLAELEVKLSATFEDEAQRYLHRQAIADLIQPIISSQVLTELIPKFEKNMVSWSKYQTFKELLENDIRASTENPIFHFDSQPGIGEIPNITSPIRTNESLNLGPQSAPAFGADTIEVLSEILNLSRIEIEHLISEKIVKTC